MLEINEIFELLMPNFLLWSYFLESAFTLLSLSFVLSDFVILSPYLCSDLSNLAFSYMLLYFSYSCVEIFHNVMKFEFNLFL